jgi:thioredoxin-like negative regulator of GroEL
MPLEIMKTQELFETLWFHKPDTDTPLPNMRPSDKAWIMYYTAAWCKPCGRVNVPEVVEVAETLGLTVWKVDIDVNDYTAGYCGVRSIPTWQLCVPGRIVATLQSSSTEAIREWIRDVGTPVVIEPIKQK